MTGQEDWTTEEFAVLLASSEIDADELARTDLTTRSGGAITVVRQGIKLHAGGLETHGILSKTMTEFLDKRPGLAKWASEQLG